MASSGLPWTPRERRVFESDLGRLNSRRLGGSEQTSLSLRWTPPHLDDAYIGLEVRNLFDKRYFSYGAVTGTTFSALPAPGRAAYASVAWRLD